MRFSIRQHLYESLLISTFLLPFCEFSVCLEVYFAVYFFFPRLVFAPKFNCNDNRFCANLFVLPDDEIFIRLLANGKFNLSSTLRRLGRYER